MKPLEKTLKQLAVVVMVLIISIPVKGQWLPNGTHIYNTNTGNVGIGTGTTLPGARLDITGGSVWINAAAAGYGLNFRSTAVGSNKMALTWYDVDGAIERWRVINDQDANQTDDLRFYSNNFGTNVLTLQQNGNVGIGTAAPAEKLEVNGNIKLSNGVSFYGAGRVQVFASSGDVVAYTLNSISRVWDLISITSTSPDFFAIRDNTAVANRLVIDESGNVGIGTSAPAELLHVGGGCCSGETIQIGKYTAIGEQASSAATIIGDNVKPDNSPIIGMATITTHASTGGRAIEMHHSKGIAFHTSTGSVTAGGAYTSERMRIDNNGYVGIGTTSPATNVEIEGIGGTILRIDGNTSNGTPAMASALELRSNTNYRGRGIFMITSDGATEWYAGVPYTGAGYSIGYDASAGQGEYVANSKLFINTSGNIGIGTTNVTEKLTVNGKILAEEVQVVLNVPDYVFAKEYKLKTLSEVSKFINEHKHLPEVPSEKEVRDNGGQVGLGEMNMTLLKKIEELTLYAIDQENNIKEQKENSQKQDEVIKASLKRVTEQDEVITELLKQNETILKRVTELEKK